MTVNVKRTGIGFELSNCQLCKYSVYFPLYPCFLPSHCQIGHQIETKLITLTLANSLRQDSYFLHGSSQIRVKVKSFHAIKVSFLGKQTERGVSQLCLLTH